MRRNAAIIQNRSSEVYHQLFYCALCDKENEGRLAVRVMGSRICWPCARAIYRRLSKEVIRATNLADTLRRVGRQRVHVPREASDVIVEDLFRERS